MLNVTLLRTDIRRIKEMEGSSTDVDELGRLLHNNFLRATKPSIKKTE